MMYLMFTQLLFVIILYYNLYNYYIKISLEDAIVYKITSLLSLKNVFNIYLYQRL